MTRMRKRNHCEKCDRENMDASEFYWSCGYRLKKPERSKYCIQCTEQKTEEAITEPVAHVDRQDMPSIALSFLGAVP